MVILEKLIIISLILYPFGELARISIFKHSTLHFLDIGVLITVAAWLFICFLKKKNILKISYLKEILTFFFIGLLSLLANSFWLKWDEFLTALFYLLRWLMYAGIYFSLSSVNKNFINKVLIKLLVMIGGIITVFGFFQLLFFPSLMSMQIYQWDKHIYRLFSVFLDPNYTGAYLVLYLILIITLMFENYKLEKLNNARILMVFSLLIVISIFLTFSRSAIITLIVAGIIYLIIIQKKKLILLLIFLVIAFIAAALPKFYIENMNLFRINSGLDRIESAKNALQIFEKNPVYGVGFNTYRYAQQKYGFRTSADIDNYTSHADAGTDNSFLFVAVTTGILGFISYIYIWIKILRKNLVTINNKNRIYKACLIATVIGIIVSGQFNNSLFYGPLMFWVWVIVAAMDYR